MVGSTIAPVTAGEFAPAFLTAQKAAREFALAFLTAQKAAEAFYISASFVTGVGNSYKEFASSFSAVPSSI